MAPEGQRSRLARGLSWIFSRENLAALAVCLIIIAVVIVTADTAPQWIYQGF